MKYLKKFETESEVAIFDRPNVVLVAETGAILYDVLPPNGVYIQHVDGSLHVPSKWAAANSDANGVAVIAGDVKFVISKGGPIKGLMWSSNTSSVISGIVTTTDQSVALNDYAGPANTKLLSGPAAEACKNYLFPNGANGYLPALGELQVLYTYKTEVNSALSKIGGTQITVSYLWSSTQYNAKKAWYLGWKTYSLDGGDKNNANALHVLPFSVMS